MLGHRHHINDTIHLIHHRLSEVFLENKTKKSFLGPYENYCNKIDREIDINPGATGALELQLASSYITQFKRLILQFYSNLTLNQHRVFVLTSYRDLMWILVR